MVGRDLAQSHEEALMQLEELTNVPKILLSPRDLALLAKILRSYLRCLQQEGKLAMPGIQTRRIMAPFFLSANFTPQGKFKV